MPSVPRVLHQGLTADKPTADATLNQGWLYYETDTGQLMQSWGGTWVMINAGGGVSAMELIDEVVVAPGGTATVALNAIPGSFKHLRLEINGRCTGGGTSEQLLVRFNGDSGANYDSQEQYSTGASVVAGAFAAHTSGALGYLSGSTAPVNDTSSSTVIIPSYTSAWNKVWQYNGNIWVGTTSGDNFTVVGSGKWRAVAAITDIVLTPASGDWAEHSIVSLYGFY